MKNRARVLIALSVLLSSVALVPFVGLPAEGFHWQQFAGVYAPAALDINFQTGQPGSFFTLTGFNFPSNADVTIEVNGTVLGTVTAEDSGAFVFLLHTSGADPGMYTVTARAGESASAGFELQPQAPLRAQEGSGTTFNVPAGLGRRMLFLPFTLNR